MMTMELSRLSTKLIQNFEFPCINRFEGCKDILNYDEITYHEENCIARKYACPLCNDFDDTAYYLLLHLTKFHSSDGLRSLETLIQIDKGNIHKTVWYSHGSALLILICDYDSFDHKLSFNLNVVGEKNRNCLVHAFTLLNVENEIKEKSKTVPCAVWSSVHDKLGDLSFKIVPEEFIKDVVVCKFDVIGMTLNMPKIVFVNPKDVPYVDPMATSVTVKATFTRISEWQINDRVYFDSPFYVNNLKFKTFAMKQNISEQIRFCVGLDVLNLNNQTTPGLYLKFSLISVDIRKIKSQEYTLPKKFVWTKILGLFTTRFITWEELIDKSNGYVDENDSIRVDVVVKFDGKVQPACQSCEICKDCTVCEECTNKLK